MTGDNRRSLEHRLMEYVFTFLAVLMMIVFCTKGSSSHFFIEQFVFCLPYELSIRSTSSFVDKYFNKPRYYEFMIFLIDILMFCLFASIILGLSGIIKVSKGNGFNCQFLFKVNQYRKSFSLVPFVLLILETLVANAINVMSNIVTDRLKKSLLEKGGR